MKKIIAAIACFIGLVASIFFVLKYIPLNHAPNSDKYSTLIFFD